MIHLKWSEFWGSDLESQLYPLLAGWAELLWTFSCIFKTATKTLLHSSPLKWRYHVDETFTKHLLHVIISYQGAYIKEKLYKSNYESIFSTLVKSQEGFPGGLDSKESAYMQETRVQSLSREDPLEKETATHFIILAWRIPWTEEPGRLRSMGLERVGHDLATKLLNLKSLRTENDSGSNLALNQRMGWELEISSCPVLNGQRTRMDFLIPEYMFCWCINNPSTGNSG